LQGGRLRRKETSLLVSNVPEIEFKRLQRQLLGRWEFSSMRIMYIMLNQKYVSQNGANDRASLSRHVLARQVPKLLTHCPYGTVFLWSNLRLWRKWGRHLAWWLWLSYKMRSDPEP